MPKTELLIFPLKHLSWRFLPSKPPTTVESASAPLFLSHYSPLLQQLLLASSSKYTQNLSPHSHLTALSPLPPPHQDQHPRSPSSSPAFPPAPSGLFCGKGGVILLKVRQVSQSLLCSKPLNGSWFLSESKPRPSMVCKVFHDLFSFHLWSHFLLLSPNLWTPLQPPSSPFLPPTYQVWAHLKALRLIFLPGMLFLWVSEGCLPHLFQILLKYLLSDLITPLKVAADSAFMKVLPPHSTPGPSLTLLYFCFLPTPLISFEYRVGQK